MEPLTALANVALGAVLGTVGQGIRVFVGLKKEADDAKSANATLESRLDLRRLWVSLFLALVIGAVAGVLAAIQNLGAEVTKEHLILLISAGYAGTDFIEGLMRRNTPATASGIGARS